MTNIVEFIKMVMEEIKKGFRSFTTYKNSKNQQVFSIGSYSISLDFDKIKIAVAVVSILLMVLANVDNSIGNEAMQYLQINEKLNDLTDWNRNLK